MSNQMAYDRSLHAVDSPAYRCFAGLNRWLGRCEHAGVNESTCNFARLENDCTPLAHLSLDRTQHLNECASGSEAIMQLVRKFFDGRETAY